MISDQITIIIIIIDNAILTNREAVTIDSCYNGGFMAGRIVSAFVAAFLLPRFSSSVLMMAKIRTWRWLSVSNHDNDND